MAVDIDSEKAALERDIESLLYESTKRTGRIAVSLDTTEVPHSGRKSACEIPSKN